MPGSWVRVPPLLSVGSADVRRWLELASVAGGAVHNRPTILEALHTAQRFRDHAAHAHHVAGDLLGLLAVVGPAAGHVTMSAAHAERLAPGIHRDEQSIGWKATQDLQVHEDAIDAIVLTSLDQRGHLSDEALSLRRVGVSRGRTRSRQSGWLRRWNRRPRTRGCE